jgi:hypothetical protein
MGGVDSWFDELDEKKVSMDGYGRPEAATGYGNYKSPRSFIILIFIFIFFLSFS